jgi:NAD(P)-dependent dehydrogenase (short-subunit alcohol dehydrogenase family)
VLGLDRDLNGFDREHPRLTVIEGDATDRATIEQVCESAAGITGVVASAGISRPGESDTFTTDDWQRTIDLNVTAVFELMRCAARTALPGASFVAISSVVGLQGFAGRAAYAASKAALDGMMRALAIEYAPTIRVNSVAPGFIMTDIARQNIADGFISNDLILSRTPLGRWGEPTDVAKAVEFLLSDSAAWITGATLPVDGGWLAMGLAARVPR